MHGAVLSMPVKLYVPWSDSPEQRVAGPPIGPAVIEVT